MVKVTLGHPFSWYQYLDLNTFWLPMCRLVVPCIGPGAAKYQMPYEVETVLVKTAVEKALFELKQRHFCHFPSKRERSKSLVNNLTRQTVAIMLKLLKKIEDCLQGGGAEAHGPQHLSPVQLHHGLCF